LRSTVAPGRTAPLLAARRFYGLQAGQFLAREAQRLLKEARVAFDRAVSQSQRAASTTRSAWAVAHASASTKRRCAIYRGDCGPMATRPLQQHNVAGVGDPPEKPASVAPEEAAATHSFPEQARTYCTVPTTGHFDERVTPGAPVFAVAFGATGTIRCA
jgi:hypothetical protein